MDTEASPLWKMFKDTLNRHLPGLGGGFPAAPEINERVYSDGSHNPDCPCIERDKWAIHFETQRAVQ